MPVCGSEHLAHVDCLTSYMSPPDCEVPPECDSVFALFYKCSNVPPGCAESYYFYNDEFWVCAADCADALYETHCEPSGGSQLTCTCMIDYVLIGTCSGPLGKQTCHTYYGCCGSLFFGDE